MLFWEPTLSGYKEINPSLRALHAGWEVRVVPQATAIPESGESQWRPGARSRVERINLAAPITQTGHHIPVGNAFLPAFDRSYITTVTA